MQFNRTSRIIIIVSLATAVIALLVWAFIEGRQEFQAEQKRERPVKAPPRVRFEEGRAEIALNSAEQAAAGIIAQTIPLASHRHQLRVYATVVPIQQIADVYQSYASQKAQTTKAVATAAASQKEYLRIKDLYEKKLESDKSLQAIEADWQSDDAAAEAARSALRSLESSIRQQWGEAIASWWIKGSTELDRLLSHKNVLIEATLSSDEGLSSPPRTALVQLPTNEIRFIEAQFVSLAQSADARFQGTVLYYIAPSSNTLLGGMNINAYLPTSIKADGMIIPRSAVVWWQGKAWFYAKRDSVTFVRLELPTDQPFEAPTAQAPKAQAGWFVGKQHLHSSVPLQIVTRGAQLLLSEEFRSQIQVGEEREKER